MGQQNHQAYMPFQQNPHHIYVFEGEQYRLIYQSGDTATYAALNDPGRVICYKAKQLRKMNAQRMLKILPFELLPEEQRLQMKAEVSELYIHDLTPAQQERLNYRYAMVQGFLFLKTNQGLPGDDKSIKAAMDDICKAGVSFLQKDLPSPDQVEAQKQYEAGKGRKPHTKGEVAALAHVSARSLRNWTTRYKKFGKKGLVDKVSQRGNRHQAYGEEEFRIVREVVAKEYLTLQGKSVPVVHKDLVRAFQKENLAREADGKGRLKCPSRDWLRKYVNQMSEFQVYCARNGLEEALKKFRATKNGVQASRPFERVEMDEMKLDVFTMMARCGFFDLFTQEELENLGLLDKKKRWWLVCAIDCRTRCIVGMTLTVNPKSSSALKCLRMVVNDKGQFSDAVQAYTAWDMFGTPESIFVDNGSAFTSSAFTSTCADLGITKVQTIAGAPSMRGTIERVFYSLQTSLMPRLYGRTFKDVVERKNHPSEKRACLTLEDIAFCLVRWVVDIYHNEPHAGLMGRTPLEQWEADHAEGNFPLMPAPDHQKQRIAFGLILERTAQKDGIRVMNIRYHSEELAQFFLDHQNQKIQVRWFDEDLGAVHVQINGRWVEVPALSDLFDGVNATTWKAAQRALRAKDGKRVEWERNVVSSAIDAIEELNHNRGLSYNITDHGWDEDQIKTFEKEAYQSLEVVKARAMTEDSPDGYGQTVLPQEPKRPTEKLSQAKTEGGHGTPDGEARAKQTRKSPKSQKKANELGGQNGRRGGNSGWEWSSE